MTNYKDYILKKGNDELGILWSDIKEHLLTPAEYEKFTKWMQGQTIGVLGRHPDAISYVYTGDFERFISGRIERLIREVEKEV